MIDALKFLNEKARMCESYYSCDVCPFTKAGGRPMPMCPEWVNENPEQAVRIVEEWSKAHPIQTNADKFKEVFGQPKEFLTKSAELYLERWLAKPYEAPKGE